MKTEQNYPEILRMLGSEGRFFNSSLTVWVWPGKTNFGANSLSGCSTNPRWCALGCGSTRSLLWRNSRPNTIKSKSSGRGSFGISFGRRPNSFSRACNLASSDSGLSPSFGTSPTAALMNTGDPGGQSTGEVWRDQDCTIDASAKFIGPVWVGAGRTVQAGSTVIGPAVIWDDPDHRPATEEIQWLDIEPTEPPPDPIPRAGTVIDRLSKRLFDIVFAFIAILVTLPLYPVVMLAIWIEDGRPFFFTHRRETIGGREFPCLKFRSMRKDAEQLKAELRAHNQADGPQFYIENDPRLTRIGAILRRYNLDELPQFFNVLLGHMSVVGPRPSPHAENQFCPPWREARLSVRPGVTGLWQIKRTRRTGSDFQEWIKYDIEYVEKRTFWTDMAIIFKTFSIMLGKLSRG